MTEEEAQVFLDRFPASYWIQLALGSCKDGVALSRTLAALRGGHITPEKALAQYASVISAGSKRDIAMVRKYVAEKKAKQG